MAKQPACAPQILPQRNHDFGDDYFAGGGTRLAGELALKLFDACYGYCQLVRALAKRRNRSAFQ